MSSDPTISTFEMECPRCNGGRSPREQRKGFAFCQLCKNAHRVPTPTCEAVAAKLALGLAPLDAAIRKEMDGGLTLGSFRPEHELDFTVRLSLTEIRGILTAMTAARVDPPMTYPLREIVEQLSHANGPFRTRRVRFDCGHIGHTSSSANRQGRCKKCPKHVVYR